MFAFCDCNVLLSIAHSSCPLRFFITEIGYGFASLVGDFGFLISIATSRIDKAWNYLNAAIEKGPQETIKMQKELADIGRGLSAITGLTKIDGAYDKMFCKILDQDFPLRLLPPYESNTDEIFEKYCEFLRTEFPQWIEK